MGEEAWGRRIGMGTAEARSLVWGPLASVGRRSELPLRTQARALPSLILREGPGCPGMADRKGGGLRGAELTAFLEVEASKPLKGDQESVPSLSS